MIPRSWCGHAVLIGSIIAVGIVYSFEITVPMLSSFAPASLNRTKTKTGVQAIDMIPLPTKSPTSFQLNAASAPNTSVKHIDHPENAEKQQSQSPVLYCRWAPGDDSECVGLGKTRIITTTNTTARKVKRRRWIFLGDSTMFRMFHMSSLQTQRKTAETQLRSRCPELQCQSTRANRCNTNEAFQLKRSKTWTSPKLGEGPLKFGLENPFCQDCQGCDSNFVACKLRQPAENGSASALCNNDQTGGLSYGGYISVEFARDVEVQSDLYTTTQENMIHYLKSSWNSERLVQEFGRPVCVVSTGHHDVAIPNITLPIYLQNVEWYLNLLHGQCDHVVWVSNNCPLTKDYAQQESQTALWNLAVLEILKGDAFVEKSTFVDVFNASIHWPHGDNIHMDAPWYSKLGAMFVQIINSV